MEFITEEIFTKDFVITVCNQQRLPYKIKILIQNAMLDWKRELRIKRFKLHFERFKVLIYKFTVLK